MYGPEILCHNNNNNNNNNNSMERGPSWEANYHSASQEIPRLLRILKGHFRVHKRPPLVPNFSQMYLVTPSHPVSLGSILILPSIYA